MSPHDDFRWTHKRLNLQCKANEPDEFNKQMNTGCHIKIKIKHCTFADVEVQLSIYNGSIDQLEGHRTKHEHLFPIYIHILMLMYIPKVGVMKRTSW